MSREPSPEEVAAALAVATVLQSAAAPPVPESGATSMWVEASRRSARAAPLQRGPWRLSGRMGRRART